MAVSSLAGVHSRPLSLIAAGVVLVALDFRVVAVDVLPDVVGWSLVAFGAWRLHAVGPAVLCLLAAAASAADVLAPFHYNSLDPITGEIVTGDTTGLQYDQRLVFDRLSGIRLGLVLLAMVAGGAAITWLLRSLGARAIARGDDVPGRRLQTLGWLVVLLWVLPFVVVATYQAIADGGLDPVWSGGLEMVALTAVTIAGGLTWVLAVNSNKEWTVEGDQQTPWVEMMTRGS